MESVIRRGPSVLRPLCRTVTNSRGYSIRGPPHGVRHLGLMFARNGACSALVASVPVFQTTVWSRVKRIGGVPCVTFLGHVVADSNDLAGLAVKTGASR
jgi:hypothetical protein